MCRKVLDEDGPAILFNNIKAYDYPVLANMLATLRRVAMALEVGEDGVEEASIERTGRREHPELPILDTAPSSACRRPRRGPWGR